MGIPDEYKSKIFNREYYKHTGFGLNLSREILDITGITIRETGVPEREPDLRSWYQQESSGKLLYDILPTFPEIHNE